MNTSVLVHFAMTEAVKVIPWAFGFVLTWLAYRYRHTWWSRLLLWEFRLKSRPHENESDFQLRRMFVWLLIAGLLGFAAFLSGRRWLDLMPDASGWWLLLAVVGSVFCVWSLWNSMMAIAASRRAEFRGNG